MRGRNVLLSATIAAMAFISVWREKRASADEHLERRHWHISSAASVGRRLPRNAARMFSTSLVIAASRLLAIELQRIKIGAPEDCVLHHS